MTQSKKRLARIGIIAAAFVMSLALGVAAWAALTSPYEWGGGAKVTTDFECPASLTVTCGLSGGYFVDAGGQEITIGMKDTLTFDQDNPNDSDDFDNIVLDKTDFEITYTFVIVCDDAALFDGLGYEIEAELDDDDDVFAGSFSGDSAVGDFSSSTTITVVYTVTAGIALKDAAVLNISFMVTVAQA